MPTKFSPLLFYWLIACLGVLYFFSETNPAYFHGFWLGVIIGIVAGVVSMIYKYLAYIKQDIEMKAQYRSRGNFIKNIVALSVIVVEIFIRNAFFGCFLGMCLGFALVLTYLKVIRDLQLGWNDVN